MRFSYTIYTFYTAQVFRTGFTGLTRFGGGVVFQRGDAENAEFFRGFLAERWWSLFNNRSLELSLRALRLCGSALMQTPHRLPTASGRMGEWEFGSWGVMHSPPRLQYSTPPESESNPAAAGTMPGPPAFLLRLSAESTISIASFSTRLGSLSSSLKSLSAEVTILTSARASPTRAATGIHRRGGSHASPCISNAFRLIEQYRVWGRHRTPD